MIEGASLIRKDDWSKSWNHLCTKAGSIMLESRFYCNIILRLRRSFQVLVLLRPPDPSIGPTYTSLFSCTLLTAALGSECPISFPF